VKYIPVAQEKDGQNWHKEQHPQLLCGLSRPHTYPLGEGSQIFPVVVEKTLNARLRGRTPAMLRAEAGCKLSNLARDLSIAGLLHQPGKSLSEASTLPADSGTSADKKQTDSQQEQNIDYGNCACPSAHKFFKTPDCWVDEVREENSEQEQNQGPPRSVEEA